jgi:3-oxoadipate enol-lactonase
MAFAETDGIRIHYQIIGDASLPVLVLSNSLGVNLAMWEPQVKALASHFRLLRYDTRGHGESSIPPGPYSIGALGQDVLNLLDSLEIEQASFCGLSMGGVVGQWLGVNASKRLHKVVLANTAAKIGIAEIWNIRIETVLQNGLAEIIPGTLERWFTPDFRAAEPGVVAATKAMLQSTNPQGYTACCAAIRDADFRASVRTISTETLVITGSYDPVASPEDGRFLANNIGASKYVELSTAHLSNVEAASEFNAALLGFFKY